MSVSFAKVVWVPAFPHMIQKAGRIFLALVAAGQMLAGQNSPALRFDAASIKPAAADVFPLFKGGPGSSDPGRISYARATMGDLIISAFGVRRSQISGPQWLESEFYAVTATMPPSTTLPELRQMIASLLEERFHLIYHHESMTVPGYELVVDKRGAKIGTGDSSGQAHVPEVPQAPSIRERLDAKGFPVLRNGQPWQTIVEDGVLKGTFNCSLDAFASHLSQLIALRSPSSPQVPIVNKTAMSGTYTFRLSVENAPESFLSSLRDAVVSQMGLRLQQSQLTSDHIVIDHLDRSPTSN